MNFKEHFLQTRDFLRPLESIWKWEILNYFPESLEAYPTELLDFFDTLTDEDLWLIDSFKDLSKLKDSEVTGKTITTLLEIIKLPKLGTEVQGPSNKRERDQFLFVKGKKAHEIALILKKLESASEQKPFSGGIEIGGGKGNLARIISESFSIPFIVADQDPKFLEFGKQRLEKKQLGANLRFIEHKFSHDNHEKLLNQLDKNGLSDYLTIGLHTCGPLALYHFGLAKEMGANIFNFPCCYASLNSENDVNISQFAKDNSPLFLGTHTLSLASRGYSTMDFEQFLFKKRVKAHRFGLHLLLAEKFNHPTFISVGETHLKYYRGSFADYANKKLTEHGFHTLPDNELESFYNDDRIRKTLDRMFYANTYRWLFGRAIEHYIISDRAVYLEENGYDVEVGEYFDENLSPRNIGMLARKKEGHI